MARGISLVWVIRIDPRCCARRADSVCRDATVVGDMGGGRCPLCVVSDEELASSLLRSSYAKKTQQSDGKVSSSTETPPLKNVLRDAPLFVSW